MRKLISIIPPEPRENGLTLSQGTKVLDSSGNAIPGITRIELIAEVDEVWRAVLHTTVQPCRIDGVKDVTSLMSESREYATHELEAAPDPTLARIEAKLDQLLAALAEEDEDKEDPAESLDGDRIPGERDTSRSL